MQWKIGKRDATHKQVQAADWDADIRLEVCDAIWFDVKAVEGRAYRAYVCVDGADAAGLVLRLKREDVLTTIRTMAEAIESGMKEQLRDEICEEYRESECAPYSISGLLDY